MRFLKSHIALTIYIMVFHMEPSIALQEASSPRTFDREFKNRYSSSKYNYEGKRMLTSPNDGKQKNTNNRSPSIKARDINRNFFLALGPLSWVLYFVLFGSICFLLYILFNEGGTGLFFSNRHKKLQNFEDNTSDNIENADINALISSAESNREYRLAIRLYYLLTLKTLALKNHIKLEEDKTNADYLNDLKAKPFANTFAYTSYLYNYIWYGKFPLEIQQYTHAKDKFLMLLNQLK